MMGYVIDGQYHKGSPPDMRNKQNSTFKQGEHNRQRKDYAREIIQPHKDGKPNAAFIDAYPEESKEIYHFTPTDEELINGQN